MSASKTIALSETAYDRLKARKREGESFSDVVERLAGERSLLEFAGNSSPETDNEFLKGVREARQSLDQSAEETYQQLAEGPDDS